MSATDRDKRVLPTKQSRTFSWLLVIAYFLSFPLFCPSGLEDWKSGSHSADLVAGPTADVAASLVKDTSEFNRLTRRIFSHERWELLACPAGAVELSTLRAPRLWSSKQILCELARHEAAGVLLS
ncbi:hypothetical protein ETAA8_15110 [Anatilimnocola aggregata]|uniref:Uncharacterized protein n=1 Tax=Anatilimnocola aggregata TaxID=2528021 RepID=A0A517Y884_9BACT|nr:hypothetical protein [Anatilimnocola aggregata]QDU26433.1 hypothetical protein ETAA8_15110 [Anatilimnocola aggregata]